MLTDGRTTDAGVTGILIAHLRAFGSGELKRSNEKFKGVLTVCLKNIHKETTKQFQHAD